MLSYVLIPTISKYYSCMHTRASILHNIMHPDLRILYVIYYSSRVYTLASIYYESYSILCILWIVCNVSVQRNEVQVTAQQFNCSG